MELPDTQKQIRERHWGLDEPVLKIGGEFLTLREATSFFINGLPGSGKSSSSLKTICKAFLRKDGGLAFFPQKPEEAMGYYQWCKEEGRADDVIFVGPDSGHVIDAFRYVNETGKGEIESLIQLPIRLMELINRGNDGGKGEAFWEQNNLKALRNAATAVKTSGRTVTMQAMEAVLQSAPRMGGPSPYDEEFAKHSTCMQILNECVDRARAGQLTDSEKRDVDRAGTYLLKEVPQMSDRTFSGIFAGVSAGTDLFLRGFMGDIYGSEKMSMLPSLLGEGACIIHTADPKTYGEEMGVASAVTLKTLIQRWAERRGDGGSAGARRPIALIFDEYQQIVTESDPGFLATCRSAGVSVVMASQNLPGLWNAMGGTEKSKVAIANLLGMVPHHFVHAQGCPDSQEFYAELIGRAEQYRRTWGGILLAGGQRLSAGASEQVDYILQPSELSRGRTGGPEHDFTCDAVVVSSVLRQKTDKPYIRVGISQR